MKVQNGLSLQCVPCGQYQQDPRVYDLMSESVELELDNLRLQDQFIIEKCHPMFVSEVQL